MAQTNKEEQITKDGSLRKTLRRWKEKWRTSSASSSRTSSPRAPLSRLPSNASSAATTTHKPSAKPSLDPLPPIPASPPPAPAALFTPTTETFIHSPADPRNRSRNTSTSSTTSPPATLRKAQPGSRRNTMPSEFDPNGYHDVYGEIPLNVVTTTIVAGNGGDKRKRTSRLRLSISRTASILGSSPSSPSLNGGGSERSSSRATFRYDERSSSRAEKRISVVPESDSRERVDSEREELFEETELIRRRPKDLTELEKDRGASTVEVAYQYIGSRDGKEG